jgi:exodeoxyribonuclease VII large subunit
LSYSQHSGRNLVFGEYKTGNYNIQKAQKNTVKDIDSHLIPQHLLTQPKTRAPLSVSQLNRAAKQLLESEFLQVLVEGEISNFSCPSSGHWYFSLKDDNAQIRCAFFKGKNIYCQQKVGNGAKVAVRGKISLFEARGEYQLIVDHLEDAGIGALQARFDALKKQLHSEGLFDPAAKQALPEHPLRIAIITSPTGAAVRDMLSVFERRYSRLQIDVVPVLVQGDQAAPQIVAALRWLSELAMHDAVVLARGGGSIEDLWAFNEESVARAIAACPLPVVSAIGHETDITIADYVADKRAPTPSAAAEILSPDSSQQVAKLSQLRRRLTLSMQRIFAQRRQTLASTLRRVKHPSAQLQQLSQRIDDLDQRLNRAQTRRMAAVNKELAHYRLRLNQLSPQRQLHSAKQTLMVLQLRQSRLTKQVITQQKTNLINLSKDLQSSMEKILQSQQQRLGNSAQLLNSLSPLNVVQRGYALTRGERQQLIKSVHETGVGAKIHVQLSDGKLEATVNAIESTTKE